jgi:uncharacterized protein YraI
MKKFSSIFLSLTLATMFLNFNSFNSVGAVTQSQITRSQVEQRALQIINLKWTYSKTKNSTVNSQYAGYVSLPKQFANVETATFTGIPYNWGAEDGIDTQSFNASWSNFLDAINKGAFAGNVNTKGGYGYIPGTAGLDCSGFVQAAYNIKEYKLSTSTLFNKYFTKISLSNIKHMDILNKPGYHVSMFDKWGTKNGVYGAYTYEATTNQYYGGIQGTKRYFMSMNAINSGYIPGRYINVLDGAAQATPPATEITPVASKTTLKAGIFAQTKSTNLTIQLKASNSDSSAVVTNIPRYTIIYLNKSNLGWYQVNYNGKSGWIKEGNIANIQTGAYVTTKDVYQLNLRNMPTAASYINGVITSNKFAKVIGYSNDGEWFNVKLLNATGTQGWVNKKYVNYIY